MKPSGSWLLLSAAAVLFSTGGAAIKATALTSWQVASFRSGIAAAVLLLLLPQARRLGHPGVWLAAPAYAATVILFVAANKLTTAANSIFLQSTAPLYLLLAGPWLLKEPVRRSDLALLAVAAAGLSMFFLGTERAAATAPDPARGNIVALVSGLTWALTIAGLRWHARRATQDFSLAMVAAGNLIAFGVTLPLALPAAPASRDVAVLAFLGVFQIGLAYVCLSRGMRHATALETSLLLLLEPVLNPIWAWLIHHEKPGGWALAGGGLILAATTVRGLLRR
jgi:drug/metabolite transporter (DMT)-like permease